MKKARTHLKGKHYHKPQLGGASGHRNSYQKRKRYYFKRITNKLISDIESAINLVIDTPDLNKNETKEQLLLSIINVLYDRSGTIWDDSMSEEGEEWRVFPEQPDYLVSNKGRVRSLKTNKILSTKKRTTFGHIIISISQDGTVYNIGAHNLVLMTFVGPRPSLLHVGMHLDNNPENNELSNLKWGTCKDNMQQAYREGRLVPPPLIHFSGGEHPMAIPCYKYDGDTLILTYGTIKEAAKENGVTKTTFHRKIRNGEKINGFSFKLEKISA